MKSLIESLSSADESKRIYAVQDMGIAGDPEMVPYLIKQLRVEPSRVVKMPLFFN